MMGKIPVHYASNFFYYELEKFHILTQTANLQARVTESLYDEESKKRKEIEEALAKEKEKLITMKKQRNDFMEELQIVLDKNSLYENQIAESDKIVKGLEQRIALAVEQLQNYKKEWDELQIEHGNALKEVQELRSKQGEVSSTHMPYFLSEFSYLEIKEATQNFDPSLKIGLEDIGAFIKASGITCRWL